MAKIKLQILAKDILSSQYTDSSNCAITKALARAGYPEYEDAGTGICIEDTLDEVVNDSNETYRKLRDKVQNMYDYKETHEGVIEDFEHDLIF